MHTANNRQFETRWQNKSANDLGRDIGMYNAYNQSRPIHFYKYERCSMANNRFFQNVRHTRNSNCCIPAIF